MLDPVMAAVVAMTTANTAMTTATGAEAAMAKAMVAMATVTAAVAVAAIQHLLKVAAEAEMVAAANILLSSSSIFIVGRVFTLLL